MNLFEYRKAVIEGTDPLISEGNGGIWFVRLAGYSIFEMSGGEINQLNVGSGSRTEISGGRIDYLYSSQIAWKQEGDPPVWVPDPHITFICDVESVLHDSVTNILTGDWLGGSSFNIQLVDVDGYSPAIENIVFIPEPMTLVLLGLGAALVRRKS